MNTEIFLKNPPIKFVQMGSSSEYGKLKSPHYEFLKCKPVSAYGKAKLLATKHIINLYYKNNYLAFYSVHLVTNFSYNKFTKTLQ